MDDFIADADVPDLQQAKFERASFIARLSQYKLITKLHLHRGYLVDLRELNADLKAVTVFRDPIARTHSQIEAWRRVPAEVLERVEPVRHRLLMDARVMPVADFVDKYWERLANRQAKMTAGFEQTSEPQSDDSVLKSALAGLEEIEYVGLTSKLADFALAMTWSLGFYNGFNPQKLNAAREIHKLSDQEKQAISSQAKRLNSVDTSLYQIAERRAFNLISDCRFDQFQRSKAGTAGISRVSAGCYVQTMADPIVGDGWHERETGVNSWSRWAGPGRFSSVYLPVLPDAPFVVEIHVTSMLKATTLEDLKVWINNKVVPFTVGAAGDLLTVSTAQCPADNTTTHVKVLLEHDTVDSVFNLYGTPDYRLKTLAVEYIAVKHCRESHVKH